MKHVYIIIGIVIAAWLSVSFLASGFEYLALVRGAFLFVGIGAIIWGTLMNRRFAVAVGGGLLIIGLLTFIAESNTTFGSSKFPPIEGLERGYTEPLAGNISLSKLTLGALFIGNAIMLHKGLPAKRILTGNMVLLAASFVMAILFGGF